MKLDNTRVTMDGLRWPTKMVNHLLNPPSAHLLDRFRGSMYPLPSDVATLGDRWIRAARLCLRLVAITACAFFQSVILQSVFLETSNVAQAAAASDRRWAFSAPPDLQPPAAEDDAWIRNGVDAFVLSRLKAAGLEPAPEASRRMLVRRIYFDLIGLPPTPAEANAFVADDDPQAYEKLVDRLLDDPRYGERWARYWLDLARYADTAGYEGDPDLPHAWRYRDYVIDAFNDDTPYDTFILEQLAGDEFDEVMGAGELTLVDPRRTVALTFLRLAPFTEPRGDESRHEMLSEMTSTVGSVFLGLTVGCAKCHDHKYDQIPTKDFYRMKAFFATVSMPPPLRGDGFQIGGPLPARFYREGEEAWAQQKREFIGQEAKHAEQELARLEQQLRAGTEPMSAGFGLQQMGRGSNDYVFDRTSVNDGSLHHSVVNCDAQTWQFFTDGAGPNPEGSLSGSNRGRWLGDLATPSYVCLGDNTTGSGEPKGIHHDGHFAEFLIYDHPLDEVERASIGNYVRGKYDGEGQPVEQPPQSGLQFWLDASDIDADPNTPNPETGTPVSLWTDRVAGVRLQQDDTVKQPKTGQLGKVGAPAVDFNNSFLKHVVSPENDPEGNSADTTFLSSKQGAIVAVYSIRHSGEGYGFAVGDGSIFFSTVSYPSVGQRSIEDLINDPDLASDEQRRRYRYLRTRNRYAKQHLARLQPQAMSLRHSFGPPYEPGVPTSRVMIRGDYDNPGEVVEPGFLSCITGNQDPAPIRLDPFKRWPTRSRRMALAKWISSPDNPLTGRVMVNRLWHWHFGRGIVATPSDFGQLSGGPSHPQLVDWLANQFMRNQWSIKSMHRLMVTSSTYRQSSVARKTADVEDPDNLLLWKFRRRRLEAEAIRDAVLAVSGRLNPERGGLPIFPPLPGDIAETVKYSNSKWDTQHGPEGRKRSVYIYQQRTLTMPWMQTFDSLVCDESRPRRRSSVTALQALAMYNGDFVNEEARYFGERVRSESSADPRDQIDRAFQLALSRPATAAEKEHFLAYFGDGEDASREALVAVCRILYNANEFVYVD
jgi:hypothetical protein